MSGHSKWSTIKHQKGVTDKRRGQAFSRMVKLITLAVKSGGPDTEANFKLRLAISKAKAINMPKDNIQKAIARGSGQTGGEAELKEVLYEGFGPKQAAILVECVTDNTNRTLSEIKGFFEKRGYSLGSPGSVAYLFDQRGYITVAKSAQPEEDELKLIDFNPIEIVHQPENYLLLWPVNELDVKQSELKAAGFTLVEYGLTYYPKMPVVWETEEDRVALSQFLEALSDLEDVEDVYTSISL